MKFDANVRWNERSPDLNPLDYSVWETLKARVFHTNRPKTVNDLKMRLHDECNRITLGEIQSALSNLPGRLQGVLDNKGSHNKHLL